MTKSLNSIVMLTIGFAVCAVTLKTLYGVPINPLQPGDDPRAKAAVLTTLNETPTAVRHFTGDSVVADAAAKLEPAIVEIHTVGKAVQTGSPFGNDPMFRQFFGGAEFVVPAGAGRGH